MENGDLISRAALLAAYDAAHKGPPGGARKLIEEAPAVDAVPVVRCRSCRHACFVDTGNPLCELIGREFRADWFCADGERADITTCGPDYCELEADDD